MLPEKFCITIASPPDRENLVAEILYDGIEWAEISQETDGLIIQFYSHFHEEYWEFPFDEALKALEQAKKELLGKHAQRNPASLYPNPLS